MRGLTVSRPALAVIIGRAGSKSVPGKNAMPIAGKPCAQWTIEHALASQTVGAVALSSDDERLVALARQLDIAIAPRSKELAGDTATVDAAVREAVTRLEASALGGKAVPASTPIVILYANAPVRPEGLIDRAVRRMLETNCDSVQSYAPVGKMHPWWMARLESETGRIAPWQGTILNHNIYRRQDLPPAHIPDGGVLVVARRALFGEIAGVAPGPHAFFGLDRRGVLNREGDVVDIDSPIDAIVADAILSRQHTRVEA
jgi:CMP-N-acetylneuraminic acid synthetase